MPRVLLLTGTCGSGKSTVPNLIAGRPGWTHVSEDMATAVATGSNVVVDATIHEAGPDSLRPDAERSGWKAGSSGVESLWRKFSGAVFPPESFFDTSDEAAEATAHRVLRSLPIA